MTYMENGFPSSGMSEVASVQRAPQKVLPVRKHLTIGSWFAISFLVGTTLIVLLYFWGEAITLRPS